MKASFAIVAWGLLALGEAHGESARFVVVPARAVLSSKPEPGAELARASEDDAYSVFRKIRDLPSGFTELETVPVAHCFEGTHDVSIRVFVHTDQIAPVLRERVVRTFSDGTKIDLLPGAVVIGDASATRTVVADGSRLSLALPDRAVGHEYTPGRRPKLHGRSDTAFDGALVYDGAHIVPGGFDQVESSTLGDKRWSVHGACGSYVLRESDVKTEERAHLASIYGRDTALGSSFLAPNTQLSWPDGRPAGVVSEQRAIGEPLARGDRQCDHFTVASSVAVLCYDKHAIQDVEGTMAEIKAVDSP